APRRRAPVYGRAVRRPHAGAGGRSPRAADAGRLRHRARGCTLNGQVVIDLGIDVAVALAAAIPFAISAYLVVLTLAAVLGRTARPPLGSAQRRFAVLVPAHNEEALIGRLLGSLAQVDYPSGLRDVYVVADNCD